MFREREWEAVEAARVIPGDDALDIGPGLTVEDELVNRHFKESGWKTPFHYSQKLRKKESIGVDVLDTEVEGADGRKQKMVVKLERSPLTIRSNCYRCLVNLGHRLKLKTVRFPIFS